jgi:hypothetical protein
VRKRPIHKRRHRPDGFFLQKRRNELDFSEIPVPEANEIIDNHYILFKIEGLTNEEE